MEVMVKGILAVVAAAIAVEILKRKAL